METSSRCICPWVPDKLHVDSCEFCTCQHPICARQINSELSGIHHVHVKVNLTSGSNGSQEKVMGKEQQQHQRGEEERRNKGRETIIPPSSSGFIAPHVKYLASAAIPYMKVT